MLAIQDVIDDLFDQVYVISLPTSSDRRAHIQQHFAEIGLMRYRFINAYAADSKEVERAFESGQVKSYPKCFRCNKLRCENDDCNNTLIAPQVANFLTYLKLWGEIANAHQRALVLEDDIVFEKHAERSFTLLVHICSPPSSNQLI